MPKLYLDSCIFIGFCVSDDPNHTLIESKLKELSPQYDFVTSDFAFTEFVSVLIAKGYTDDDTYKLCQKMVRTKRLGEYPFDIVEIYGKDKDYGFSDFFVQIQEITLNSRPGLGDAIHIACITNNHIRFVLTTNPKDFQKVKNLKVFSVG